MASRSARTRAIAYECRELWGILDRHKVGPLFAFTATVLGIIGAAVGKNLGLPLWAWAELASGALVISLYREIRSQRAMDDAHAKTLMSVAWSVHDSIPRGAPIYSDGNRQDPHLETQFRNHFPEVAEQIDQLMAVRAAEPALKQRVFDEISNDEGLARWPYDNGWNTGAIVRYAQSYAENVVNDGPRTDPQFAVSDKYVVQGGTGGGTILRFLPAVPSEAELQQAESDVAELIQWVRDLTALPSVEAWSQSRRTREKSTNTLLAELQRLAHSSRLSQSRCNEECHAY